MTMERRFGWIPQLPDYKDYQLSLSEAEVTNLPQLIDLRSGCPPVYDQLTLGSCTGQAWAGIDEFVKMKQKQAYFTPSRLFIYYNERLLEGTVKRDSGAQLRDGIKTLIKQGVCPETEWPYIVKKFKTKPCKKCYKDALKNEVIQYLAVTPVENQFKGCLAAGYPFVFGFTVYSSFMTDQVAQTGIMPMPGVNDSVMGGHAVMAVGFDNVNKWYIIRNSWGEGWGEKGYFYMPFDYMHNNNLCSDFWTIRSVE